MINLDLLKEDMDKDPNEPEGGWEDPIILYVVDRSKIIRLLDIVNYDKVNPCQIDFIFEYFEVEEESKFNTGIYKARLTFNSYMSGAPDCQEWETDVNFHDDQKLALYWNWEDEEKYMWEDIEGDI